jgi:hypothetical protein
MNELSANLRMPVHGWANRMGGVTGEPFHAQMDNITEASDTGILP